jgi:23S rRNA (uracil1939-C5)-methyltransferase
MPQNNAKNEVTLDIDRLSYGPYGIGRAEGRVFMVPHTAPGDRIATHVVEERERFSIGELVRIVSPSAARRTPPCPYAGTCGGCSWQHVDYETQLAAKQQSVNDALRRIGKLSGYDLRPIIPAADEFHYRRRIRLQVGRGRELGFYGASSHDLVEIDACLIALEPLSAVIETLRRWVSAVNNEIEHIEIVSGNEPNETVVVVKIAGDFIPRDEPACASLIGIEGRIRGLIVTSPDGRKVWGEPKITVTLGDDLGVKIDADVFTQVNPLGNRRVIEELLAVADFRPDDRVVELFSGAGNFTLALARRSATVVAVEGDRRAVANGKLNAQRHAIDNIRWICAPVPKALAQLKQRGEKFTKIVLDPPRAGAKGIEANLSAIGALEIFYVSCNPASLARDLAALDKHGYKLRMVQPLDLFPQTFHVETLAVLEKQ